MVSSKLVFIDIDGTLADERHIVPDSAVQACREAQRNGHRLFICTGRSIPKIEKSILDLGFDGVVSVAGAQANMGDEILFQHFVSPEAIDAADRYFREHHIEAYQWQGPDGMYISEGYRRHLEEKGSAWNRGEFARFWHRLDQIEIPEGSTLGHVIHVCKGSYFILGDHPEVSFEETKRDLSPWFETVHGSYDRISANNGELLINGVDKGTAVRDVAARLGYDIADTIAIGDSDNDTAMLKAAGTSVAMGNAIHGIKDFCDLVTTDIHEDGLANAFRTLGLIGDGDARSDDAETDGKDGR
ncbi:hydrolase [Bifidobacterium callitrichos]|uniref:Hydrolase n=1 Tax=Bifidobacterium callitrichos TaxID=762209 RepID=A0A2T3G8Z5_9BIFI|nr:HAD family hydrolase [Bifidobacterium callitrichos]PST45954.1 hydrolase [Bifidobacterium callitrichos]